MARGSMKHLWLLGVALALLATVLALDPWGDESVLEDEPSRMPSEAQGPGLRGRTGPASGEDERSTKVPEAPWAIRVTVRPGYGDEVIADADVRVRTPDGTTVTQRTNQTGVAVIEDLPTGPLFVVATAEGFAISEEKEVRKAWDPTGEVELHVEPAGPVRGQVVDAADGRPVADARVTALEGGMVCIDPAPIQELGRTFGETRTGGDGRFAVQGMPLETLCSLRLVRVDAPGYRTVWKIAPPPGKDASFVVRLVPGGMIRGTVTAQGSPVAGAQVVCRHTGGRSDDPTLLPNQIRVPEKFSRSLFRREEQHHVDDDVWVPLVTTTDASGRYEIHGLGLGEAYAVGARASGHASSAPVYGARLTHETRERTIDFAMNEACLLTVICKDAQGRPWPDVAVSVSPAAQRGWDSTDGTTDEQGVAYFDELRPGSLHVSARYWPTGVSVLKAVRTHAGPMTVVLTIEAERPAPDPTSPEKYDPSDDASTPQEEERLENRKTPTLVARLAVPDGVTPPKHVSLYGLYKNGSGAGGVPWEPDGTGTVLVEWTWERTHYTFVIDAEGFLPIRREVSRSEGSAADLGTLTLDPGQTVRGVVRLPDGTPLGGARVEISHPPRDADGSLFFHHFGSNEEENSVTGEVETKADGSFSLAGFPRGAISVELSDPRFLPYRAETKPLPHTAPLEIVVRPGALLWVHAEDEAGLRATRRHVTVTRLGQEEGEEEDTVAYGRTDVEGRFSARVDAGTYRIGLGTHHSGDATRVTHVVKIEAGVERTVRLTAPPLRK